jgi:ABC-type glycerol-3-phosphate transport system permease component
MSTTTVGRLVGLMPVAAILSMDKRPPSAWPPLMFLATLPVLLFFLALQRHFVKGLTGGATKG